VATPRPFKAKTLKPSTEPTERPPVNMAQSQMQDFADPVAVEIRVRQDGSVIWINVDGRCVLRICQIKSLVVEDNRLSKRRIGKRARGS